MASIKVAEFAFPRMEAPDLDEMEECVFACERCKDSCEAMTSV